MLKESFYWQLVSDYLHRNGLSGVLSIDLETLIRSPSDFLTNERIIAVSLTYFNDGLETELFVARDDTDQEEDRILELLDSFVANFHPGIIIGYNQSGYDLPLLRLKMRRRSYAKQLWNLKYSLSVAYCLDMMPVISDYLAEIDGDYKYRKLSEVVNHETFSSLDLDRKKSLVHRENMNVGEVIEELWRSGSKDFVEYCRGDTRDVLSIFMSVFSAQERS